MPISTLVGNFDVESCQLTNSTPPVTGTFLFPSDGFVECSELGQGAFQGLGMVNLLTGVQRQIGIHAKVCAYAFTCSGQYFFANAICHDIQPQCSSSVSTDLNIADLPFPIAMVVIQNVSGDEHKLLFLNVAFLEGDTNTALREFVACLKLRRTVASFAFELRGTDAATPSAFF